MYVSRRFYVYELIDPRNRKAFYVGKGRGQRSEAHVKDARRGIKSAKCDLIRDIEAAGLKVKTRFVDEFDTEEAALRLEAERIAFHGIENLTNILPAGHRSCATPDPDVVFVRGFLKMARKTGLRDGILRFCGEVIEIPQSFFDKMVEFLREIADRRGLDFIEKISMENR